MNDKIEKVNSERKHLEGLLKDRISFYLVFASVFFAGLYRMDESARLVALIAGTLVSFILGLAIWRSHRLVTKALEEINDIDPDHPYIRYRKDICFPPNANKLLLSIPIIITLLFGIMTWLSVARPNHAMQLTAPQVTAPASTTTLPPTMQVPRPAPR